MLWRPSMCVEASEDVSGFVMVILKTKFGNLDGSVWNTMEPVDLLKGLQGHFTSIVKTAFEDESSTLYK